jgi:hypothetical protein
MPPPVPEQLSRTIETLYRSESGRVLATLVRLLADLDLAEESMHEAFAAALESWPQAGIPDNPRPWLISTARFKAIDAMRRRARFDGAQRDLVAHMESRINDALAQVGGVFGAVRAHARGGRCRTRHFRVMAPVRAGRAGRKLLRASYADIVVDSQHRAAITSAPKGVQSCLHQRTH